MKEEEWRMFDCSVLLNQSVGDGGFILELGRQLGNICIEESDVMANNLVQPANFIIM